MKTEAHVPGFHAFALQTLSNARCRATAGLTQKLDFIDRLRENVQKRFPFFYAHFRLLTLILKAEGGCGMLCRGQAIGLAVLFFGAGVLVGSLLPPCWTVRLLAAAVIAAGLLLCQSM